MRLLGSFQNLSITILSVAHVGWGQVELEEILTANVSKSPVVDNEKLISTKDGINVNDLVKSIDHTYSDSLGGEVSNLLQPSKPLPLALSQTIGTTAGHKRTHRRNTKKTQKKRKEDREEDKVEIQCQYECCKVDQTIGRCRGGSTIRIKYNGNTYATMNRGALNYFWSKGNGFDWCCGGDCSNGNYLSKGPFNLITVDWKHHDGGRVFFTGYQCDTTVEHGYQGYWNGIPKNVDVDPITMTTDQNDAMKLAFEDDDTHEYTYTNFANEANGSTLMDLSKCTPIKSGEDPDEKEWCDMRGPDCTAFQGGNACKAPDLRVEDDDGFYQKVPYDNRSDDDNDDESEYTTFFDFEHKRSSIQWWCGSGKVTHFNSQFNVMKLTTTIDTKPAFYVLMTVMIGVDLMAGIKNPTRLFKAVKTMAKLGKVLTRIGKKSLKRGRRAFKKAQERKKWWFTGRMAWKAYNCPASAFVDFAPSTKTSNKSLFESGSATESCHYSSGRGASVAIDGITDGNYSNGSVTHTCKGSTYKPNWWQAKLQKNTAIVKVVVWNRTDCCQSRLNSADIEILDESENLVEKRTLPSSAGDKIVVMFDNVVGRYIKITQYKYIASNQRYLSLAEVEVFESIEEYY